MFSLFIFACINLPEGVRFGQDCPRRGVWVRKGYPLPNPPPGVGYLDCAAWEFATISGVTLALISWAALMNYTWVCPCWC